MAGTIRMIGQAMPHASECGTSVRGLCMAALLCRGGGGLGCRYTDLGSHDHPPFPRTSRSHEQWKEDAPPPPPAPQTPGSDERCLRGKSSFVKGSIFLCDCWYTNPWIRHTSCPPFYNCCPGVPDISICLNQTVSMPLSATPSDSPDEAGHVMDNSGLHCY